MREKETEQTVATKSISTTTLSTDFSLPDDMQILQKIPALIKAHPGDIAITIGKMQAKVNKEGLGKVRDLLG